MTPVHVCWWTGHPEVAARLFWDQAIVLDLLDRSRHELVDVPLDQVPDGEGAVVIVPGRFQADADKLNAAISALPWVLLIITSDEEASFPYKDLQHPNLTAWVQYPRPGRHDDARRLPLGPTTDTHLLNRFPDEADTRRLDWFLAGQITHQRRVDAAQAIVGHPDGLLVASSRFADGLAMPDYLRHVAEAKTVPAPSGPVSPDSFRLWEALEACALPIVDARASHYDPDEPYWPWLLEEDPPFPVVEDWATLPKVVDEAVAAWPENAVRAAAWWQGKKRRLARQLDADVTALTGHTPKAHRISDLITVVITTSPIPSHPDTAVLDETIESVRSQLPLLGAEILVAADGVPPALEHRGGDWWRYLHRVCWAAARGDHGPLVPLVAPEWRHQALTLAAALQDVHTPLVLVMEHDTPLLGDIDWDGLGRVVLSGQANVVRLHHETAVLDEHQHLMVDQEPQQVCGVPLLRTAQWSQRPQLADVGFYRQLLDSYFAPDSRSMVEDCVHGVLENAWLDEGEAGWDRFRVWMYAPAGDMRRSGHLDGRDGDPKGEMTYAYPGGGTPQWAPRASADREPEA